ncbi:hypothetical protein [Paenibacillus sp. GYB003]|uniref:hypothetical protein n=1 Tax=Paenibacillus sp. GYB003 TaxID=2994392 RepID=UPI002F9683D6
MLDGIPLLKLISKNLHNYFNLDPNLYYPVGYDGTKVYVPDEALGNSIKPLNVPLNLEQVVILKPLQPDQDLDIVPLNTINALVALTYHLYNPWSLLAEEYKAQANLITQVLNKNVNVHSFGFPKSIDKLPEVCNRLDNICTDR